MADRSHGCAIPEMGRPAGPPPFEATVTRRKEEQLQPTSPRLLDQADDAMHAGARALWEVQRPDGVFDHGAEGWTSVLATVGAVSALHCADPVRSADLVGKGVEWLCRTQAADGGWSTIPHMPTEAGPTAVAAATLQHLAPERAAETIRAARSWLEDFGGLEAIPHREMAAVCRRFYARAGWLDPEDLPRLPLELAAFPRLFRELLDFRAPLVAAAALAQARTRAQGPVRRLLNRAGRPSALRLIRQIYEHEGMTGEFSEDPWAAGLTCEALARSGAAPDLVASTVEWLRSKANPDGSWNMMPLDLTWSVYAVEGLMEAGHTADPRLSLSRSLFHDRQQDRPFTAFGCPAGFWGWSSPHGWPAAVETAEITSALARMPGGREDEHVARGVQWLLAQQDGRGSWSLCVRNTRVDNCGPCPHTTAQALLALLNAGVPADGRVVRTALRWLLSSGRPDGSFDSVWYRSYTSGTSVVLEALVKAGAGGHPAALRAAEWLARTQRPDGSWSTGDGVAPGTVEETAWAVCALLAAGRGTDEEAVRRGVVWLLAQESDGRWPQAPVSEFIRGASRFPNGGLTNGLALRALAAFLDASAGRVV
ncbi:prenyltransferase/squalene oxidase repeat-containing protein [Streptomyces griseoaurantiacus]|uniref:prenyltransferase/squalene oxidase repeat-containing protein n=1 Tax=Streptomyces griseoaurantiacus TaxID=68213 RepID=UPI00363FA328